MLAITIFFAPNCNFVTWNCNSSTLHVINCNDFRHLHMKKSPTFECDMNNLDFSTPNLICLFTMWITAKASIFINNISLLQKKDLKKTFSQVINIFRVVYEIEEKTCQYWRDQWFFILKRVSFMSWWKLISPIFYECLIVKRNKKRETRNSGKKQEL